MSVTKESMALPVGKTCGDCLHFSRCEFLFQCRKANSHCDFSPSRFLGAPLVTRPAIVNVRDFPFEAPTPYIYVGRYMPKIFNGHPLANPFKLRRIETRDECLRKYVEWLDNDPDHIKHGQIEALASQVARSGLPLGCWCAPLKCHADILADRVEAILLGDHTR